MPDRDAMPLAAADLIEGAPASRHSNGSCATLDMVTSWLHEQRQSAPATPAGLAPLDDSRNDRMWSGLALIGAPTLWPDALKALWLGEPVWNHLQKQAGWFQVVEAALLDTRTGGIVARAARPWRRVPSQEPALDKLLQQRPSTPRGASLETSAPSDRQVTVLVGQRSRLAVRTLGYPPEGLREALQAVCDEADALLDEPMAAGQSRQRLIEPLLRNALFRSGPRAAPWNKAGALRFLCLTGLVAAGLAFLAVQEEIAWHRAVAKLDAEPGIRLTGVEVRWGVRHIEGLRDGMSADPVDVLRSQGRPLDHVEFNLDTVVYRESSVADRQPSAFPPP